MELFVSTTTSLSLSSLPRRPSPSARPLAPSVSFPLRRRHLLSRGLRCANADWTEPAAADEPASASAVFVTEKPDAAVEEEEKKGGEAGAVSGGGGGAVEEAAAASFAASDAQSVVVVDGDGGDPLSKLDFEETSTYVVYGSGAFLVGWILSAIVSAIDSIPLLPKLLEIVGLGYSIWFSTRYLLFKENRDELFAKIDDLKERII